MPELRALTVRQPWAACIAHLDKRVENRPKPFPPSLLGEEIAIHAGLAVDDQWKVQLAAPGLVSPAAKQMIAKLLEDAAGMLREQA